MEIHYTLVNDDEPEKVLNRGKTIHAFVKMNGKPTRMPDSLKQVLEKKWNQTHE
jgi:acyl-CoA thioesterase FadM